MKKFIKYAVIYLTCFGPTALYCAGKKPTKHQPLLEFDLPEKLSAFTIDPATLLMLKSIVENIRITPQHLDKAFEKLSTIKLGIDKPGNVIATLGSSGALVAAAFTGITA